MPVIYPYITVIGRIPGNDEDTAYHYENMSRDQAHEAFENDIYNDTIDPEGTRERVKARYDSAVFVSQTLVSDAPITEI